MEYNGYSLVEVLKGRVLRDDMDSLVMPLARRVADLERELRTVFRADGTPEECESIDVARARQIETAKRSGDQWHTNKLVPPPGAHDMQIIAVLDDGSVRAGWIHISGQTIGQMYLVPDRDAKPIHGWPWDMVVCWTYKPGGV